MTEPDRTRLIAELRRLADVDWSRHGGLEGMRTVLVEAADALAAERDSQPQTGILIRTLRDIPDDSDTLVKWGRYILERLARKYQRAIHALPAPPDRSRT